MSEPMYGCEYEDCAEECCYPANMLRVYEGKVWCEGCWDNAPTIWPDGQGGDTGCDWVHHWDLEPFVPEHEKRIAALGALLRRYRDETPIGHQPSMIAHKVDELLGERNE